MAKKNLILTIAINYPYKKIAPFMKTFKELSFKGDLVIFYDNLSKDTVEKLTEDGAMLVKFDPTRFEKDKLSVVRYRFILFYEFLKSRIDKYDKIFITDVRDVVFQSDIFDYPNSSKLTFFLEGEKIKNNPPNIGILMGAGGRKAVEMFGDRNIICAGTTLGNIKEIIHYLKTMKDNLLKAKEDQGLHIYLIYSGKFPKSNLSENFEGPVLTLGFVREDNIKYNKYSLIIDKKGRVIPVLHQYDRIPYLAERYGFVPPNKFTFFLAKNFTFLSKIRKVLLDLPFINRFLKRFYQQFT
jgi:hypothetical protein